jgi:ATP-dependent DNA ligase
MSGARLEPLAASPPAELLVAGDPLDPQIQWVLPELIVEVSNGGWSGAGRVRHPVFVGIREDKAPRQVVRPVADPEVSRGIFKPRLKTAVAPSRPGGWKGAVPPRR